MIEIFWESLPGCSDQEGLQIAADGPDASLAPN
jgi:hypothetical protein